MTRRRFQRSTRSPAPIPNTSEGRYETVAAIPVADLDPVRSRIIQMNASWNTESPNCEKNCAIQRNTIGARLVSPMASPGARRGPALVASGPLVLGVWLVSGSGLRGGRPRLKLRSVVLEVPHERRLHAELAEERVELSAMVHVLVVHDLDADEAREALAPRCFHEPCELFVGQGAHGLV